MATFSADFAALTGDPATSEAIVKWQRAAGLWGKYVDGICGPMTLAAIRLHLDRRKIAGIPRPSPGELVFVRGAKSMIRRRNHIGDVAYDCSVYWLDACGERQGSACSTMPMQITSKASPFGLVAVVRPGEYIARRTTHKGAPALRLQGSVPCWRNRSGWPFISRGDVQWSEELAAGAGCPQTDDRGTYATDILFHPGPPHGFSIGCFTAPIDAVTAIVNAMPRNGIKIRLVEGWE